MTKKTRANLKLNPDYAATFNDGQTLPAEQFLHIADSFPTFDDEYDGLKSRVDTSVDIDGTLKAGAVDVTAVLSDDVVTGAKIASATIADDNLATDVKIGSLASLTSAVKSSVVGAINSVRTAYEAADNVLDTRIDNLGVEAGNANAEVTAARTSINYGTAPASLSAALRITAAAEYNVLAYDSAGDIETGATDCRTAFNAALTAISSAGGGTLVIPAGAYVTSEATPIVIPSNTRIIGAGAGRTVISSTATTSQVTGMFVTEDWDTATGYDGATNIEIAGITFVQTSRAGESSANNNMIAVGHAQNVWIHHCEFVDHYFHCVDCCGSKNVWITDNVTRGNSGGVSSSGASFQIDQAATSAIYNINDDNTPSEFVYVCRNKIFDDEYAGVHLHRDGHQHIVITENQFEDSNYGIRADPVAGYDHWNIVIANNIFRDLTNRGVHFPITVRDVVIANNVFYGMDRGIYVGAASGIECTGINITGNVLRSVQEPIYVNDTFRLVIANNNIDLNGNTEDGVACIWLDDVKMVAITGNVLYGIGFATSRVMDGIDLNATSGSGGTNVVTITGNTIYDLDTGIDIADNCTNVKVRDNTINTCTTPLGIAPNLTTVDHDNNLHYDSGWFAVTNATKYGNGTATSLAHGFGVPPRTVTVWYASSSTDPTDDTRGALDNRSHLTHGMYYTASGPVGMIVTSMDETDMILQTGSQGCYAYMISAGTLTALNDGYARIIASA